MCLSKTPANLLVGVFPLKSCIYPCIYVMCHRKEDMFFFYYRQRTFTGQKKIRSGFTTEITVKFASFDRVYTSSSAPQCERIGPIPTIKSFCAKTSSSHRPGSGFGIGFTFLLTRSSPSRHPPFTQYPSSLAFTSA